MIKVTLAKTLGLSVLLHVLFFTLFAFSFGREFSRTLAPSLSWWGRVYLQPMATVISGDLSVRRQARIQREEFMPRTVREDIFGLPSVSVKPLASLTPVAQRSLQMPLSEPLVSLPARQEPVILFHPLLPYQFELYFKDRQVAHIELIFQVKRNLRRPSVQVKRRISSGNLEADLLSARYISHYLYMQQQRFPPNTWQTVKIDLSTQP